MSRRRKFSVPRSPLFDLDDQDPPWNAEVDEAVRRIIENKQQTLDRAAAADDIQQSLEQAWDAFERRYGKNRGRE